MDTKLSVALLSGISLFMSLGAFALSNDESNELNWSYAMGGTVQANSADFDELTASLPPLESQKTDTADCSSRPQKPLTLTYEDEAMPLAERVQADAPVIRNAPAMPTSIKGSITANEQLRQAPQNISVPPRKGIDESQNTFWKQPPQVETRYVESNSPQVQYPITRQYPISVQYPVTVQRNMTVEQPVIMQQPVIVRRPVVVQQDVTVQRQPTFIQQQPMIMQQQPSFIQQQPMYLQAPAAPMSRETLNSLNGIIAQPQFIQMPMAQPMIQPQPIIQPQPAFAPLPQQQMPMPPMAQPDMQMQPLPNAQIPYPQHYQVQGQIQAQPIYTTVPPMYVQSPMTQQAPAY